MDVISSLGGILLDSLIRQWHYIKDLRENMQNLLTEWGELHTQKEDVIQRVDRAKSELRNILNQNEINLWLENVNRLEEKVNGRRGEFEEDKRCLYGCLPNELAKEILTLIREVGDWKEKRPSVHVATDQVPPAMLVIPTKSFEGAVAEMAFKKISDSLMDEKIAKIGVYGMGGVGKTTIIKCIKNSLEQENIFSEIIFVTVSRFPIKVIQEAIADQIGLPLDRDYSEETLSAMLHEALQRSKRFLLILDDLWSELSLEDIGIPQPNADRKVVLTTRLRVVCQSMRTDKAIKVEVLSPEDAWSLFQENAFVNDVVHDAQVKDVAEQVAKECGGLPLAIVRVGRRLRGVNDIGEWRNALNQLKASTADILGMGKVVFNELKSSFDRLQNEKLQTCFLYCSLFPENYNINANKLIDHWIWDGLIPQMENKQAEVDNGLLLLNELIQACMLQFDDDYSNTIKMYGLMRDMAIHITRDSPRFMVKAGMGLEEALTENEWPEDVERISLMDNNIETLSGQPRCRKLRTLLLNSNYYLSKIIPHSFFDNMCNLRVLDLSHTNIEMLPDSICNLEKLHVLLLINCERLRTLPFDLGKLKELGVLYVSKALVEEMPESLGSLKNLLELRLDGCVKLKALPSFAKLKKLRNFNIVCCESIEELPRCFSELENLHDLNLEGCGKLNVVPSLAMPKELKNLNLSGTSIKELPESLSDLQNHLEELKLRWCSKLKTVPSFANLKKLEKLYLTDTCIEELPQSLSDLEKLCELELNSNIKLKKVPSLEKVRRLRILNLASTGIEELPKGMEMLVALNSLVLSHTKSLRRFPHGILPKLSLLQEFSTKGSSCLVGTMDGRIDCKEITGLTRLTRASFDCDELPSFFYLFKFLQARELELRAVKSSQPNETFLLECCWNKYHHHNITIREHHGSTCLSDFLVCLGLVELDDCYINSCDGMQFGLARLDNNSLLPPKVKNLLESLNRGTMVQQGPLAMLTGITVSACPKLKNLLSLRFLQSLRSLKSITVEDCDAMEELIIGDDRGETGEEHVLQNLQDLQLINLPAFERISSKSLVSLDSLRVLHVSNVFVEKMPESLASLENLLEWKFYGCSKLKTLPSFAKLKKLRNLNLVGCISIEELPRSFSELENLHDLNLEGCGKLNVLPSLAMPKELKNLNLSRTSIQELPKSLFDLQNLEELNLRWCSKLKMVPSFASLKKLEKLYLSGTCMEELPESLFDLKNLKELDLSMSSKLKTASSFANLKNLEKLYLTGTCMEELPESLFDLKNLKELDLSRSSKLKTVSSFANLKKLEKLYLTDACIEVLPESLSDLEKLRELKLYSNKKLKKVPSLEKCEQLRILNLASTGIEELPKGMERLAALESLDLSHTKSLRRFPHGILPNLYLLQEFLTKGSSCLLSSNMVGMMEGQIDCKEITELTRLTKASFDCDDLPSFFYLFKFLQVRKLELRAVKSSQPNETFLFECCWNKPNISNLVKDITMRAHHDDIICFSDFLPCLGLVELDDCYIDSCDGMQFGLAGQDNNSLWPPKVKNLLESLNRGTMVQQGPLAMLTGLIVSASPKVKNLFSLQFLQSLRSLKSITVEDCDAMEELIVGDDHGETGEQNVLPKLQVLKLINLPAFERISSKSLVSLKSIVIKQCPRLKKIPLCLDSLQSVTSITAEDCDAMEELIVGDDHGKPGEQNVLPKLQNLELINLPAFERISSKSLVSLWYIVIKQCPRLKKIPLCLQSMMQIEVEDCDAMELIGGDDDETGERIIHTKLQFLRLINLPALKSISRKPLLCINNSEMSIMGITIRQCPHLKMLPLCIDSLQSLGHITVQECDTMEELLVGDDDETSARIILTKLWSLSLANLPALERICRKPFVCNSLQKIEITQCPRLKMISLCIDSQLHSEFLCGKFVGKKEWWDALDWHDPTNTKLLLQPFFKEELEEEEGGGEEEEAGEDEDLT